MNRAVIRGALLGCAILNYVLLVAWFLLFLLPHD
jgi:hypothetical protein